MRLTTITFATISLLSLTPFVALADLMDDDPNFQQRMEQNLPSISPDPVNSDQGAENSPVYRCWASDSAGKSWGYHGEDMDDTCGAALYDCREQSRRPKTCHVSKRTQS